ncbi:MAG: hypothetical protein JSS91_09775 [Bacteroidetes bacterium]|nr:hypothetical protein [Bacteroidota bacterium]
MDNTNNETYIRDDVFLDDNELSNNDNYDLVNLYLGELKNVKRKTVDQYFSELETSTFRNNEFLKAALPSFLLLIISFFIGVDDVPFIGNVFQSISSYINPNSTVLNKDFLPLNLWWFPFILYILFVFFAFRANTVLRKEYVDKDKEPSEASITRIIDRYSGIVDGLGTALPLLGAAILLISIEKGPAVFLGLAVPFEIKSILILAIAKLFDSVFDVLALQYQSIQERLKNVEQAFFNINRPGAEVDSHENENKEPQKIIIETGVSIEQLNKIQETVQITQNMGKEIKEVVDEINKLKLPDKEILERLDKTSNTIKETLEGLKNETALKSLENLVKMTGLGDKKDNKS